MAEYELRKGRFRAVVEDDPDPENPLGSRQEQAGGESIRVFTGHRNFTLGGGELKGGYASMEAEVACRVTGRELTEAGVRRFFEEEVTCPIYMYDHSGYALQSTPFSDQWDSGKLGYLVMTRACIRELYGVPAVTKDIRKRSEEELESMVKLLNDYVQDDTYMICVYEEGEDDPVKSHAGFYGSQVTDGFWEPYLKEALDGYPDEAPSNKEGVDVQA